MNLKHEDTRLFVKLAATFVAIQALTLLLSPSLATPVSVLTAFLLLAALLFHFRRLADADRERHARRVQAVAELTRLLPLRRPMPPMQGWSASPELATTLLSVILDHRPTTVVELGSGVSSIVVGYALELAGRGEAVSFDHNADFLEATRHELVRHGIKSVTLSHAPLGTISLNGHAAPWYELDDSALPGTIDLLVIDGPPRMVGRDSRYPALPMLRDRLSPHAVVVFDDALRAEEAAMIRQWARPTDGWSWSVEHVPSKKGIAVLRRLGAPVPDNPMAPATMTS
jgi:predicted O-methyltransferase YrrM